MYVDVIDCSRQIDRDALSTPAREDGKHQKSPF
jgi:hypothetical protein